MDAPVLYHVDHVGAFNGITTTARLSPADALLGQTVWLVPEGATAMPPPETRAGEVAVLRDEKWSVLPDRRGQRAWDKQTGTARLIETPGDPGEGETLQAPASAKHVWSSDRWVLPLDDAKVARLTEVGAELEARMAAGFAFGGKTYQLNDRSRAFINARATRAGWVLLGVPGVDWPEGIGIIAADNSRTKFTAEQFRDFALEADRVVTVRQVRARDLKDVILKAADAAALAAIDVTTGWD